MGCNDRVWSARSSSTVSAKVYAHVGEPAPSGRVLRGSTVGAFRRRPRSSELPPRLIGKPGHDDLAQKRRDRPHLIGSDVPQEAVDFRRELDVDGRTHPLAVVWRSGHAAPSTTAALTLSRVSLLLGPGSVSQRGVSRPIVPFRRSRNGTPLPASSPSARRRRRCGDERLTVRRAATGCRTPPPSPCRGAPRRTGWRRRDP